MIRIVPAHTVRIGEQVKFQGVPRTVTHVTTMKETWHRKGQAGKRELVVLWFGGSQHLELESTDEIGVYITEPA